MVSEILFYVHAALLLLFGVFLSAAFAGVKFTTKNAAKFLAFSVLSGGAQIAFYMLFSEDLVWKIYPLISHFPLFLMLLFGYRKKASVAVVSVATAYLCCQPAKIVGIFAEDAFKNQTVTDFFEILTLIFAFVIIFFRLSEYVSKILGKDSKTAYIFGITPLAYYIFDYIAVIYTDFWSLHIYQMAEFLAFMLCVIFLIFCFVYHKEYEEKADAQRNEQIIRISLEQQKKEFDAIKRSEQTVRIMRHDMRHFISNLQLCIESGDKAAAQKMLSSFAQNIDSTVVKKYCENPTINYIISGFAERCKEEKIEFLCKIETEPLCDETMLSTIISNALENAINAQKQIPEEKRKISLMLKMRNEKLLLSVKNPFHKKPVFVDGIPISDKKGHGYGTQSIAYLTERMGGNCKFAVEDNKFVLMVVI